MSGVSLSDAIQNLREELSFAHEQGKTGPVQLTVSRVEIELKAVATKEAGADGKLKWWLVEAGVNAKSQTVDAHVVKVTLQAADANGQPLRVSQERSDRPS